MGRDDQRKEGISPELDELSSDLVGEALDLLAAGEDLNVLLVMQDAKLHTTSLQFSEDGEEACLLEARDCVRKLVSTGGEVDTGGEAGLNTPVRYAICYEGAIADESGTYQDALMLEFGEKDYKAYSAYTLIEGKGQGDNFAWSEPAPAGEIEPLI